MHVTGEMEPAFRRQFAPFDLALQNWWLQFR